MAKRLEPAFSRYAKHARGKKRVPLHRTDDAALGAAPAIFSKRPLDARLMGAPLQMENQTVIKNIYKPKA